MNSEPQTAARWARWMDWLFVHGEHEPRIEYDGWTVRSRVIGKGPTTWGTEYVNGNATLRCIDSGAWGRHPTTLAYYIDGVEQWRQRVPHHIGYGSPRHIPMAVDRIASDGTNLARY